VNADIQRQSICPKKPAPKKGTFFTLYDDEEEEELKGRNKGKPNGREKDLKKKDEATSLREKIDESIKSKQTMVAQ
jgi:hypothetical protein